MTPVPAPLGGGALVAWRLDQKRFGETWDNGEGARQQGGRWNSRGRRVVYCSVDPATAILEVAVHKGFKTLDTVAHVLTSALITDPRAVHVVQPSRVPNANWLRPGFPSAGQQAFGDALLTAYSFVLIPSAVSTHSWNLLFDRDVAKGLYLQQTQEDFALDTGFTRHCLERSGGQKNAPDASRVDSARRPTPELFAKLRRAPRVESVRYGARSDA